MSEEVLNNEAQKADLEKIEKIKEALLKIENKESKFLFCVPETPTPTASVYEIYFHANAVKKMGHKVVMLTEKDDYEIPKWIENELTQVDHVPMNNNKLSVGPEDVMVIPDVFSNVMEQTKNLPCVRVGLLQSVDYMINALVPGTDWRAFGIMDIITTSTTIKEFVEAFYGMNKFNVQVYNPSVPDYFKRSDAPQQPVISIVGRNPNEIAKIVKLFFAKYPQYAWVTFDPLLTKSKPPQPMRRKDYAERLRGNFAAVWVDRLASWGTFPLECMKSGVVPIGVIPDITPEYLLVRDENGVATKMKEMSGVWTDSFYDIPVLIGEAIVKFLDDNIGDDLYDSMEKIASEFTAEKAESELVTAYGNLLNERKEVFQKAIGVEVDTPAE